MISDEEYLERIVAGIHATSGAGTNVKWNEIINGRQFDVVVRFRLGTLEYLVLIEVKNRSRRASAADVEAFVTKARDQNANKAVFVTAAGFQEGAIGVARRHGVDLFTLNFDPEATLSDTATRIVVHQSPGDGTIPMHPEIEVGDPQLVGAIEHAMLIFVDGDEHELPFETSQMSYYAEKTLLEDGRSLGDLMQSAPQWPPKEGTSRRESIEVDPPLLIRPPDEYFFPEGRLRRIELTVFGRMSRSLSGNVMIEPSSFRSPVRYTNALTGETTIYSLDQLPLNTDPVIPGAFYFVLYPLRYLHCEKVSGNLVTWQMVESFQNRQLVRVTYTQKVQYTPFYIPVSDKAIIKRLKGRLEDYLKLSAPALPRPGFRTPPRRLGKSATKKRRR